MLQLTTIFFVIALSVLAGLHYLALEFFLYWHYTWLDIPMHLLGGIVAALAVFTLYDFKICIPRRLLHVFPVWLLSLVVILAWEVFKLYAGKEIDEDFVIDTIVDVVVGSLGSIIGFFIAKSLRQI